jgi:general nucleoside transport system permease protein
MWESILSVMFMTDLGRSTIRMATPLAFAAMGGVYSERSGVINVGLEGMMLTGAFTGAMGSLLFGNPWMGLLCAALGGGAMGLIHSFVCVTLRANQIVSGIAINIFALGMTSFFLRAFFGIQGMQNVPYFTPTAIPLLGDIPIVGPILFQHGAIVYLGYLVVPVSMFILYRTTWGLTIRGVGEHPRAADTVGSRVLRTRYLCVFICGMLAGVGGAFLSLDDTHTFADGMSGGRGYIAYAAMIFGRWSPLGAFAGTLLFGLADSVQLRMQAFGAPIPYQFLLILPYAVTILVLYFVKRVKMPAALGVPYAKE